jgi:hypothetical protein
MGKVMKKNSQNQERPPLKSSIYGGFSWFFHGFVSGKKKHELENHGEIHDKNR